MLRENYWIPFARTEGIGTGGQPQRVRLLGKDLVAFRGEDGQVGLLDERCPHRRASLALAFAVGLPRAHRDRLANHCHPENGLGRISPTKL